jgi:hypothetical protein
VYSSLHVYLRFIFYIDFTLAPPRIQLNPTRQVVRPGDDAFIQSTASGDQPIDIQWSALGRDLLCSVTIHKACCG